MLTRTAEVIIHSVKSQSLLRKYCKIKTRLVKQDSHLYTICVKNHELGDGKKAILV